MLFNLSNTAFCAEDFIVSLSAIPNHSPVLVSIENILFMSLLENAAHFLQDMVLMENAAMLS
jgi:hypothetical protein